MGGFGTTLWGGGTGIPAPAGSGIAARDIIYRALRKCGQLRPAASANDDLYQDGLNEWAMLVDSWAAERTMGFSIPDYQYAVKGPGSQSGGNGYLIGPTAQQAGNANDFTGPRPESIVRANCVMTSVGPQPVYISMRPISAEEWASLSIRQIPAINVTSLFYYNPQFPNGVLNVFPPLTGNSIELFCWQALAAPVFPTDLYSAPPGYLDAVIWSLAERLWPMCTSQMAVNRVSHAYICGKAYEACQKVRMVNRPIPTMVNDFRAGHKPAGYYDSFVSYTGLPT